MILMKDDKEINLFATETIVVDVGQVCTIHDGIVLSIKSGAVNSLTSTNSSAKLSGDDEERVPPRHARSHPPGGCK
jgi:hypothetical protein